MPNKIKKQEVISVFRSHKDTFSQNGFKVESGLKYINEKSARLEFQFDRYGWTDDVGWGFVARLYDLNHMIESGIIPPKYSLDVSEHYLTGHRVIDHKILYDIYRTDKHMNMADEDLGYWFRFYTIEQLEDVLNVVLEPILKIAQNFN